MREPLTRAEVNALLSVERVGVRAQLAVALLLDTGLRVAEAAQLVPATIDWQARRATVIGKGGKRRVVPLTPRVHELLQRWFALHEYMPARRTLQKDVARVARAAGIRRPVSPHVLRHTFAVLALQNGVSLASVQKLLGHAHLTTTEIYLNVSNEEAIREYTQRQEQPR